MNTWWARPASPGPVAILLAVLLCDGPGSAGASRLAGELAVKEAWLAGRFRRENAVRAAEKLSTWREALGDRAGELFFSRLAREYQDRPDQDFRDDRTFERIMTDADRMPCHPGRGVLAAFLTRTMFAEHAGATSARVHSIGDPPPRKATAGGGGPLAEPVTGFGSMATRVDRAAPHSLRRLDRYLFDRFPRAVVEDCVSEDREIELVCDDPVRARAAFRARGYTVVREIQTVSAKSHMVLDLVYDPVRRDLRYLVSGIRGRERKDHILTMLWLARVGGRSIPARLIRVREGTWSRESENLEVFRRTLAGAGPLPGTILINYQNGITSQLIRRGLARRKAAGLVARLGPAPVRALCRRLEAAPVPDRATRARLAAELERFRALDAGMARPGAEIFADLEFVRRLEALEDLLGRWRNAEGGRWLDRILEDGALPGAGGLTPARASLGTRFWGEGLDWSRLEYVDRSGRTRELALFRCVWGADNVRNLARAIVERLPRLPGPHPPTVLLLGTCGELAAGGRVGDVHLPSSLGEWTDLSVTACEPNLLRQTYVSRGHAQGPGTGFRVGGATLRVPSPLIETVTFLDDARRRGFDSLDVESAAFIRELKRAGLPLRLGVGLVATDVPGTDRSLEDHGAGDQSDESAGAERLADLVVEALGAADVSPVQVPAPARKGTGGSVGVFFGTFDPPHRGHLAVTRVATDSLALDRLYVVPNLRPSGKVLASGFLRRHRMVELLVEGNPRLSVPSRRELMFASRWSPTGDFVDGVLRMIGNAHPEGPIIHVVGTDSFNRMVDRSLLPEAGSRRVVAVVLRPGEPMTRSPAVDDALRAGRVLVLRGSDVDLSSTRVRVLVQGGAPLDPWLPPGIERFVRYAGLYRNDAVAGLNDR